jgi:hypothetical protein
MPTDGSADDQDRDNDRMTNREEWIAGTHPANPLSALRVLAVTNAVSGLTITWQSAPDRTYQLERATDLNLPQPFSVIQQQIPSQPGTTSYTDTEATGAGPFFYRVHAHR